MKRLLFFIFTAISCLLAQSNISKFTHITTDNGLSQSNVKSILHDHLGFMWFGTFDGLNKYDGYQFKIYKYDHSDSTSIKANSVLCLFEDSKKIIWIGTDQGLCYYNRDNDNFTSFITEDYPEAVINSEVSAITEDNDNNLWFATSKGLIFFNRDEQKFYEFLNKPGNSSSVSDSYSKSVFKDSKGNIWIGTASGGLNLLNPDKKSFSRFSLQISETEITSNYEVRAISEDINGRLFVGTYGHGLGYVDLNNLSSKTLSCFSYDAANSLSLSSNLILSLFPDNKGGLWIGTDNGGINFLTSNYQVFIKYKNNPDISTSLNNNSIYSVYKDIAGDLWFGTFSGGINYANMTSQALNCFRNVPGNTRSLASNTVRDFAEDEEGNIWIATDGGGLDCFSPASNLYTHYNTSTTNLNRDAVLAVHIDKKGNVWVGTWDGGLSQVDKKSKSFKAYTKDNSSIKSNNIFDIAEDFQGRLWLATTDGLVSFDPVTKEFLMYTDANSLANNHCEVVSVDSKGNVLAGTTQGLSILNPETGTISSYRSDPADPNTLSTGFVTAIFEESPSVLWIGTINGLNKINTDSKKVKRYYEQNGLPNNSIRGILKDAKGYLWLSTNKGISKFDTQKEFFKNFTKLDGIQGNEYVIKSSLKTRSGMLLFGGVNGFDYFNPDLVIDNPYVPPVVITDFQVFNKSVKPGAEDSPLKKDIGETKEIVLSYKQSVISFQFTALNFRGSDKNQYAYMLKGFDEDWNYVGTARTASYTNLDPGEYEFIVKGSNNDGLWNEKGTSVIIVITPPFWSTWWFRTIIFLIAAAAIYWFIRRARDKRKSLEEINSKLETEIKLNKEAEEEKQRFAEEARRKDEETKRVLQQHQDYLQNGFDLLLNNMNRFAEGDLDSHIEISSDDSFARLFTGFNKAVNNFHKIILNLLEAIKSTAAASDQINISAEKIHKGTMEQSLRSEEVASAVQQMTENIYHSSKNSESAAKASIDAKKMAAEGGEIVKKTIGSMSEISNVIINAAETIKKLGESSNQISEIVELIEDVADQTNLLALNAAIEAARAGEHGRGFAVVADEVKKLSERTTSATKNIAGMIKRIQTESKGAISSISSGMDKVKSGQHYAEQAGVSLDKIIVSVTEVSALIEQVAAANEEQSATAEHISESVVTISDVSRDNAAGVEQVTTAIEDLRKLTADLEILIHKFKLGKEKEPEEFILEKQDSF